MQNQSKEVVYLLEANEFDWEIKPGKTVKCMGI